MTLEFLKQQVQPSKYDYSFFVIFSQTVSIMKNLFLVLFFLLLAISCEESATENEVVDNDSDTSLPNILVSGLEETIEVKSTIEINISDDSDMVSSVVFINGEEVLSTVEKSFSLEINPYDYPIGETTLIVTSTDEEGNTGQYQSKFDIKRLLVTIAAPFNPVTEKKLIFINDPNGKLLETYETTRPKEVASVYTTMETEVEFITVSIASFSYTPDKDFGLFIDSYSEINPGTDLSIAQERNGVVTERTQDPIQGRTAFYPLIVNDSEQIASSLLSISFEHLINVNSIEETNNGFISNVQLSTSNPNFPEAFLFTSEQMSVVGGFGNIAKEDYSFLSLTNENQLSTAPLNFQKPEEWQSIEIPGDVNYYFLSGIGFRNETAYSNNQYHYFYQTQRRNETNQIEIPMIEEFSKKKVTYIMFSNRQNRVLRGYTPIDNVITWPDWHVNVNNDQINFIGNFNLIVLYRSISNDSSRIQWDFRITPKNMFKLPYETFELPEDVLGYLNFHGLEVKNPDNSDIFRVKLTAKDLPYTDIIFNYGGAGKPWNYLHYEINPF